MLASSRPARSGGIADSEATRMSYMTAWVGQFGVVRVDAFVGFRGRSTTSAGQRRNRQVGAHRRVCDVSRVGGVASGVVVGADGATFGDDA